MATLIRTEGRMIVATGEARTTSEVLDILEVEVVVVKGDAAIEEVEEGGGVEAIGVVVQEEEVDEVVHLERCAGVIEEEDEEVKEKV